MIHHPLRPQEAQPISEVHLDHVKAVAGQEKAV